MEMHQLRYFVAVAQTHSFSRAAERCHVSQPSLSQQIQKLERGLGQHLFDRRGRSVTLTDAGKLLLDRALKILETAEDVERELRDGDNHQGGQVAIGAIPTIAPYLLPVALERFLPSEPRMEVTVHEDVTQHTLAGVEAGELDLGIVALPINDDRLEVEPLFSEPLRLCLPRNHPLARKRILKFELLREERFILLNEMHCLSDQVLSLCRQQGYHPRIACRSAQISTIQSMIALGQGLSLLPEMAERADKTDQRVYRSLSGDAPQRTVAVVWRKHRYHSAAAERFLATLRQVAREWRGKKK